MIRIRGRIGDWPVDLEIELDAQDWMNERQLNELWTEITRTATDGARVIFRTAAEESILTGKLAPALLDKWHYQVERSQSLNAQDRSAIYGGFHIYEKAA